MENRKSIILCLLCFFPFISLAYDGVSTHQALTQEAIKLFQVNYPQNTFPLVEILTIEKGSFQEDDPVSRCLNHFFDPIHNEGILFYSSSKDWAQNTFSQNKFLDAFNPFKGRFSSSIDYTWERGIYDYVHGNKNRGLEALGHVIHLVEDASVPDHTRLDNHYFGGPYEEWAKRFTKVNIDIANGLILKGEKPILYTDLDSYFDNLAEYSNGNFFSLDTIFDKRFVSPIIKKEETVTLKSGINTTFGMGVDSVGNNFRLVQISRIRNLENDIVKTDYIFDNADHLIVSDYWTLLSKQAVLNGAGVIKLFFDKVEEEKQTNALLKKNRSFVTRAYEKSLVMIDNVTATLGFLESKKTEVPVLSVINTSPIQPVTVESEVVVIPSVIPLPATTNENLNRIALLNQILILLSQYSQTLGAISVRDSPLVEQNLLVQGSVLRSAGGQSSGNNLGEISEMIDEITPESDDSIVFIVSPPLIIFPTDFSTPFATTSILFEGTSATGTIILVDFNGATTTVDEMGKWELLVDDLPIGTTTINFIAQDLFGSTSTPLLVVIFVETVEEVIASKLDLVIEECVGAIFNDICLAIWTEDLHFSWTINRPGEYTYVLKNIESSDVIATTTDVSIAFNWDDYWPLEGTYYLIAYDLDGQVVATATSPVILINNTLVINEIGWRGTSATDTREWIELYNNYSEELLLDDFSIRDKAGNTVIQLSGTIPAQSYYLIEREDDAVVSDVVANFVSDFSTTVGEDAIPDVQFYLELVRKTDDIEKVFDQTPNDFNPQEYCKADEECLSWYQSVERCFPEESGISLQNWNIGDKGWPNGLNSEGLEIHGTPGQRNGHNRVSMY